MRVAHWSGLPNADSVRISAFTRHADSITDVEFSHGGQRVASASADRTVRVFNPDAVTEEIYFSSPPLPGIVTSVQFHRKDNILVSGCDDGGVRLHDIKPPAVVLLGKFDAPARRPEFSADGEYIVAASGDKTARVWRTEGQKEIARIEHPAPVTQATFRPSDQTPGLTFITTATDGEIRVVKLDANFKPDITETKARHPGAAVFAQWSSDGRWLATVGGSEVLVWEWVAEGLVARLRLAELHPATSRAEFSPDAKLLVTYGGDHLAYVWDLEQSPPTVP